MKYALLLKLHVSIVKDQYNFKHSAFIARSMLIPVFKEQARNA